MHTSHEARTPVAAAFHAAPVEQRGFTTIELLVAAVVLAVGLVALTGAGAAIVRLESRGERLSRIAGAGETRFELLRSAGCAATAGTGRIAGLEERWGVTRTLSHVAVIVDSASWSAPEGAAPRVYVFRSAVRC